MIAIFIAFSGIPMCPSSSIRSSADLINLTGVRKIIGNIKVSKLMNNFSSSFAFHFVKTSLS